MLVLGRHFAFSTYILILLGLNLVSGQCWNGWIPFNGSCYLIPNVNADWHEASFECEIHFRGYLAEINSAVENTFLRNQAKIHNAYDPNGVGYWIGASDMEVEGIWLWMNSRLHLTFSDWLPGQPDDYQHHEDCIHLHAAHDFHWNDYDCSKKAYFICERPASPDQSEILG